ETERFRANDSGQVLLVTIEHPGARPDVQPIRTGKFEWRQLEFTLAGPTDVQPLYEALRALGPASVVDLRVQGVCDLATELRLRDATDRAKAAARALVADLQGLRLQPTDDDVAALKADGFVGEVVQQLRSEQAGPNGEVAAGALLQLARILADVNQAGAAA
ncbi:MAG TPA: DNA repair exonuclease, partial [Ramlibacter sp.]|nr:DNA repair exonuclease [Ramlibacter sp.]